MSYNIDVAAVLMMDGYDPLTDFSATDNGDGTVSLVWNHADPQPTEQEIAAKVTSQPFLDYFAENIGGDPVRSDPARMKRKSAKDKLDDAEDRTSVVLRAVTLLLMEENNAQRAAINAILDAVDGAASLAALKTSVAAIQDLPERNAGQLRTAIKNKISAGDADS